jgi:hypothetical protein
MRNCDLEELRLEIHQILDAGRRLGETEIETISRLVLKEREKHRALVLALEEISRVATAALDHNKEKLDKVADVLEWRNPLH